MVLDLGAARKRAGAAWVSARVPGRRWTAVDGLVLIGRVLALDVELHRAVVVLLVATDDGAVSSVVLVLCSARFRRLGAVRDGGLIAVMAGLLDGSFGQSAMVLPRVCVMT